MKKRTLVVLSLFLINFVSAQLFDGYNNFSISGFFSSPDAILLALFFIIAAMVSFVLKKSNMFGGHGGQHNRGIVSVISFSISLIAVYGIYKSGFSLENLFSGLGLSSDIFYLLIWVVAIAGGIFIIWRLGIGVFFLALGILIMIISVFTDLIYEKTAAFVIGLVISIIGLFFWKKSRKWWEQRVRSI